MRLSLIIFCLLLTFSTVQAQQPDTWQNIAFLDDQGNDMVLLTSQMHSSENFDLAIIGGPVRFYNEGEHLYSSYLIGYDGENWASLIDVEDETFGLVTQMVDHLDGIAFSVFKNLAESEYSFSSVHEIYYFDGNELTNLGVFELASSSYTLNSVDGELLFGCLLPTDESDQIALLKYSSEEWVPAFASNPMLPTDIFPVRLNSLMKYSEIWYLGGNNFLNSEGEESNLLKFDNNQWIPVTDINGNHFAGVCEGMVQYGDILAIQQTTGSNTEYSPQEGVSNGLIFWDGQNWSAPPILVSNLNSDWGTRVFDTHVVGSHLFVGGSFVLAGGEVMRGVARWDGNTWCGLQTNNSNLSSEFFAATFAMVGNQVISFGAPEIWSPDEDLILFMHDGLTYSPCSEPVSVADFQLNQQFRIYPNPVSSDLNIELPSVTPVHSGTLVIYDTSGRVILESPINSTGEKLVVNLRSLQEGVYILKIFTENEIFSDRLVINR